MSVNLREFGRIAQSMGEWSVLIGYVPEIDSQTYPISCRAYPFFYLQFYTHLAIETSYYLWRNLFILHDI